MVVSVTDSASPSNALDAAVPGRRLHILECLYQQAGWGIAIGDSRTEVMQDINKAVSIISEQPLMQHFVEGAHEMDT